MDIKDDQIIDNKMRRMARFWFFISCALFAACIILAIIAYHTINNYQRKDARGLKSLAINLAKKQEAIKRMDTNLVRRIIDGVYVEEGEENLFPLFIVIDNNIDARPSAGLAKANLVIETEAEGGITRYLAIFASGEEIKEIGPVRSARPYFIDWVHEFSPVFTHCGGSPDALARIVKDNVLDLNEFYNANYFWRNPDRPAPHNVMTNSEKLYSYLDNKNLNKGKYFSWKFKDESKPEELPEGGEIKINYILRDFIVRWEYNKDNNNYQRYLGGKAHKDIDGLIITAKNIIIQYVPAEEIDEELRLKMEVIGDGEAIVCLDGLCRDGEWKKKSKSARTRFYDAQGDEFVFNAGATWIEVVRPEYEVSY